MADVAADLRCGELLGALQLGDSFFPSGRYTLSHGLESFIEHSNDIDIDKLQSLLIDYLRHSIGSSEAVAVATANRAARSGDIYTLIEVDQLLFALKLPSEASAGSTRSGKQVLSTIVKIVDEEIVVSYNSAVQEGKAPGSHAVVTGIASAVWGLQPEHAVAMELHAYITGLLGAALRLMRMDHVDAQTIIHSLSNVILETAANAVQLDYRDMSAFAPKIEIMQMQHEQSHLRLFAS